MICQWRTLTKQMLSSYASVFRAGLFRGRRRIVTGAGSGIGRCTAHELAALGARVALLGRKEEKLKAVAAEIGAAARTYACDIREEDVGGENRSSVLADFGRIDGLVNNAGGQFASPLETISAKGWDAVVRTNLTGGFLIARECYTQWMKGAAVGRDRQHDCRHVERHARHGTLGRGARRHAQLHRDGGARVGAGPRQRRRAGLDRLERARPLSAGNGRAHPRPAQARAARAPGHRIRSLGGDRVPALAGRGIHLGLLPARGRRGAECQARRGQDRQRKVDAAFDGFHLATKPKVLE